MSLLDRSGSVTIQERPGRSRDIAGVLILVYKKYQSQHGLLANFSARDNVRGRATSRLVTVDIRVVRADGNAPTAGADVFIKTLTQLGIDTVCTNTGTSYPPIIEALSKSPAAGRVIQAIAVPYETAGFRCSYGHFLNVWANAGGDTACRCRHRHAVRALLNASRERFPLSVGAGCTPYTDDGHAASRGMFIRWSAEDVRARQASCAKLPNGIAGSRSEIDVPIVRSLHAHRLCTRPIWSAMRMRS
jgi:hypothetical protein